ncbi:YtpI family protein [Bacillus massilinigeriensis]|uniref:YtpI family protein n=1 Tax=Bacillus mediterraneensis TaxID=1805474 RepID=UPI0008F84B17|nr:YtpI family protein [Bacillus mediterraneensis]
MPILVLFIVLSFSMYVFYKIKFVRSSLPGERQFLRSKSGISLGLFVALFGVNQLFLFQTTVTYIIASIFILLGGLNVWAGIKAYRHILPIAADEAEKNRAL